MGWVAVCGYTRVCGRLDKSGSRVCVHPPTVYTHAAVHPPTRHKTTTTDSTRLAEETLGAAAHGEGVVDVHVVVLRVHRLLHQGLVDLPLESVSLGWWKGLRG